MNSRKKIAIASVLKPVDDARNYKKIGNSLAQSGKYEVHIIGYPVNHVPQGGKIIFHQHSKFSRISIKRVFAPWLILKKLIEVKPDVIIANTHEILTVILVNKILFGSKIIYDIQENYYLNIRYSKAFPKLFRLLIAGYVRTKERLLHRFYDGILMAEKCYKQEMPFFKNPLILENKSILYPSDQKKDTRKTETLKLIYTGTISEEYGIFEAIDFIDKLVQYKPDLEFLIIGYCPNEMTRSIFMKKVKNKPYIKTRGIDTLIPHNQIIKEIISSDFSILPYRTESYYSARIPTRIYECLSLKTPMIIRKNPHWKHLFTRYDAFLFSDFNEINQGLLELLKPQKFFKKEVDLNAVMWDSEEKKLLKYMEDL